MSIGGLSVCVRVCVNTAWGRCVYLIQDVYCTTLTMLVHGVWVGKEEKLLAKGTRGKVIQFVVSKGSSWPSKSNPGPVCIRTGWS